MLGVKTSHSWGSPIAGKGNVIFRFTSLYASDIWGEIALSVSENNMEMKVRGTWDNVTITDWKTVTLT